VGRHTAIAVRASLALNVSMLLAPGGRLARSRSGHRDSPVAGTSRIGALA